MRGLREVRHGLLRAEERAARVDLVHQVEALHRRVERAGEADRRGVVDEDVDAAEALDRRGDRRLDLRLVADVGRDRERLAAGRSTSAAAVWIVPGSFGCGSVVLAAMTTLAPSAAARSAMAWPMPREAPVMKRRAQDMVHRLHGLHDAEPRQALGPGNGDRDRKSQPLFDSLTCQRRASPARGCIDASRIRES